MTGMADGASRREGPAVGPGTSYPVGATVSPGGINFCVYSRDATGITLALFDDVHDERPTRVIPLDPTNNRTYHYWHIFVPGLCEGQLYGFYADGPHQPGAGLLFDPQKLLLDPYARGVVLPSGYSREVAARPGDDTAVAAKSVATEPDAYDWEGDRPLKRDFDDSIIYELHVRGFTARPNSGISGPRRGTYAGLVEKIPYLRSLGITTVELMPVQQFDALDAPPGLVNYWGYQPMALFAPHSGYSSRSAPLGPFDEFRDLVKAMHRAGIEVILDVVFNHTAEGGVTGPVQSLRGLDNLTYYMVDPSAPGTYDDYTGTGNTINANETIVRRLILDCLRHWVQHIHVDGFRFDLAAVLSRGEDGTPLKDPPILWDIDTDPVLAGTKIIAEAWDAAGLYEVTTFAGDRWAVWNGRYRDTVRRFIKGDSGQAAGFADCLMGSAQLFHQPHRDPTRSINFVTTHDGFTLNDLVSYDAKHNLANGEGDRDGADSNDSWNCGAEGPTDDPEVNRLRLRQIKNLLTVLMVSQGRPMLLMGDEVRRTQQGNNNAYCHDDTTSWFDWDQVDREGDLLRFVREFLDFRKESRLFTDRSFWGQPGSAGVSWHGVELGSPDFGEDSHSLALELSHPGAEHLHVIVNAFWQPLDFALPDLPDGQAWRILVDTDRPSPDDFCTPPAPLPASTARYRAEPRSTVILTAGPAN